MLRAAKPSLMLAFRHTFSVAAGFWAACLLLTTLEAAIGSSIVIGGLFFCSIPMLVGGLVWANGACVAGARGPGAVLLLGVVVLVSSSLIIGLGMLASSSLLRLMTHGLAPT